VLESKEVDLIAL